MSGDEVLARRHSAYRPDEPEFYFEQQPQESQTAELTRLLGRLLISITRTVAINFLVAPINRVFLLQCAEGELIKNGRLTSAGFGGLRGCLCYIFAKEGILGFFRGCFSGLVLMLPANIANSLALVFLGQLQQRLASVSLHAAATFGFAVPLLRVVLTAPVVGFQETVLCNYRADIVACNGVTLALSTDNCKEEEAYLYNTAWEAAAAVRARWGLKGLFFRCVDVDIVALYARSFTMRLMGSVVLPTLDHFVKKHISRPWGRVVANITFAIGVHIALALLFHPFHVIRVRRSLIPLKKQQKRKKSSGVVHYVLDVLRQDGITALWAGFRMRFLQTVSGVLLNSVLP